MNFYSDAFDNMTGLEKDRLCQINEIFYHLAQVEDNGANSLSLDRHILKTWFANRKFRSEMYVYLFLLN